tara:strand:+ start:70 stop:663 length:594 start_codon:yes stop_codon:yes gene_type:complete
LGIVSTVATVADTLKRNKEAAEAQVHRLSSRVEQAQQVAHEHERITGEGFCVHACYSSVLFMRVIPSSCSSILLCVLTGHSRLILFHCCGSFSTASMTQARRHDLAELSLSRTQVRRMESERTSAQSKTDHLRRRIAALETDYFTQSKACETLIEEVTSQQVLLRSMQDNAIDRDEQLFAATQRAALVRHQNTELSR